MLHFPSRDTIQKEEGSNCIKYWGLSELYHMEMDLFFSDFPFCQDVPEKQNQ